MMKRQPENTRRLKKGLLHYYLEQALSAVESYIEEPEDQCHLLACEYYLKEMQPLVVFDYANEALLFVDALHRLVKKMNKSSPKSEQSEVELLLLSLLTFKNYFEVPQPKSLSLKILIAPLQTQLRRILVSNKGSKLPTLQSPLIHTDI
ncbi:MAG: hypothetical protein HWE27_16600 [Gammaproteobacteria bacterium]|nr:hypothetical protein [Gammaproteobacteria bacterium]